MGQEVPSYYVSGVQAPGTTGSLAGKTVWPFSDVDIFSVSGSPPKVVAANDVVALLDDVANYSMVKTLSPPAGTGGDMTIVRGAKSSDGSFDDTRATRPQLTFGTNRCQWNRANICLADLKFTGPNGTNGALFDYVGSSSDRNLLYNLLVEKGAGTATVDVGVSLPTGVTECSIIGCKFSGLPGNVVNFGSLSNFRGLYNEIVSCGGAGFVGVSVSPSNLFLAHNVIHDCSSGFWFNTFGTTGGCVILHNSVFDCAGSGFDLGNMYYGTLIGNLTAFNGSFGFYITQASGVNAHVSLGNAGYQNASGTLGGSSTGRWSIEAAFATLSALTLSVYTPTAQTGMPTLGELLQGEASGRNYAGALTPAGAGGSGAARRPVPRGHNI